jgi:polysaccharide pyruvyl transferase WcaK-like protein
MNNTLLLIGNRGNKNMGDELILVGILKYFLDRHPNRQSVQVSK